MSATKKCTTHNGTYSCVLDAGHDGDHSTAVRVETNARNEVIARSRILFRDGYSPIRRAPVPRKV